MTFQAMPRRLLCALVAVAIACLPACAQSPQLPPTATQPKPATPAGPLYPIAGVLTDSTSSEGIAGATLTLLGGQPRHVIQTTQSDPQGNFALNPVPAGKYSLGASRRGYMTSAFDQHDQLSSAIVTGPGQDTEHIPFRLNPGATIRGVITDDSGEPVPAANVLLMRKSRFGGQGEHFVKSIAGQTDDTGLFEFWNLVPGTYYLAVRATPWYAIHPTLSDLRNETDDQQRAAMAALDVAYPVTYFDGTTDEASASPVTIQSGDHIEANLSLHAVPAVHLTMRLPESKGYTPMPTLHQTILGEDEIASVTNMSVGAPGDGMVEITGVPPGQYSILTGNPPHATELDTTGSQDVDTSAGSLYPPVTLNFRMADGTPPPHSLRVILVPENLGLNQPDTTADSPAPAQFQSVPPGRWHVIVLSQTSAIAVVSIQTGSAPTSDNRITVRNRPVTATVNLAIGKANMEGFALKDGKGQPGVLVILVPANPDAHRDLIRRDQSDSDGSFVLPYVIPGDYSLIAIEDAWELDWAKPEVLSRYLPNAIKVTMPANPGATVHLGKPVPVQPR